ncbi:MAG: hypothetical protein HQL52_11930 [Magnetococcales bacterium]|nr:hypothetical protein [Magnetococcales bacterium]
MATKIDPKLQGWFDGNGEALELIVEAELPRREVQMRLISDRHAIPMGIEGPSLKERDLLLQELEGFIKNKLSLKAKRLKAAGAVVVLATAEQTREILKHPLVKMIRPNRQLGGGGNP